MSKQIKLTFNSSGVLVSHTIDQIRKGDSGVELTATFQGKNNANYTGRFTLTRPDGKKISGIMGRSDTPTDFYRVFGDLYYFAVNGAATLTVFLYSGDEVIANGQVTISIEQTDFDEVAPIDPDEYEELLELIATKMNIVNGILVVENDADIGDLDQYEIGQTFLVLNGGFLNPIYNGHKMIIRYNGTGSFSILVDYSNAVQKTGDTMSGPLEIKNEQGQFATLKLTTNNHTIELKAQNDYFIVTVGDENEGQLSYRFEKGAFWGNGKSLGVSSQKWVDLWLSGSLKDGSNSVTIANIAKKDQDNTFEKLPQTKEGRVYNNDRQMTDKGYVDNKVVDAKEDVEGQIEDVADDLEGVDERVEAIEEKLPTQASQSNKLADRDWVNSTINSLAAFYITKNAQGDPFDTLAELQSATVFYSGGSVRVPTRNDYCLVRVDEEHESASCRYIYQGGQWEFQFVVNETAFTEDQVKAINSGITQEKVAQIQDNTNDIAGLDENKLSKIEAQNKLQAKVVSVDITITPDQWSEDKEFTSENVFGTLGFVNSDDLILFNAISNEDDAYANTYKVRVDDVVSTEANETYVYFKCNDIPTGNVSLRVNLIKKNTILGDMTGFLNVADLDGTTIVFQNGKVRVISGGIVPTASQVMATNGQSVQQNLERIDERIDDDELVMATKVVVESASDTTIGGLSVPALTIEQIESIYNALVAGNHVVVSSNDGEKHFTPVLADSLSDETAIHFIYYNLLITYWIENDEVKNEYIDLEKETPKLYSHFIHIQKLSGTLKDIWLTIYSRSNTQLTQHSEISLALQKNGNVLATGSLYDNDMHMRFRIVAARYTLNGVKLWTIDENNNGGDYNLFDSESDNITDTVTEITE